MTYSPMGARLALRRVSGCLSELLITHACSRRSNQPLYRISRANSGTKASPSLIAPA